MKKTLAILLICLAAASCGRESTETLNRGIIRLTVETDPATKGQVPAERSIKSLTVFIFDDFSGELESVQRFIPESDLNVSFSGLLTLGSKTAWAYANYDVADSDGLLPDWHPIISGGLEEVDFDSGSFPMRGTCTFTVESNSVTTASIPLVRTVRRTVIHSIRNSMQAPLTIIGAYLADVYAADIPVIIPDESLWCNKWGRGANHSLVTSASNTLEHPGLTAWFDSSDGLPATISAGKTRIWPLPQDRKGARLYSMPNPSGSFVAPYESGASWEPGITKLVLVASIGGNICYYGIPLDNLPSNYSTSYDITIYGVGSTDPETPVESHTYTLASPVTPWQAGATYTDNSTP